MIFLKYFMELELTVKLIKYNFFLFLKKIIYLKIVKELKKTKYRYFLKNYNN